MLRSLGDKIRDRRRFLGLSQAELGQQIGVHQKQISAYERGVNLPSSDVLIKLSEILGVSLDYLCREQTTNQPAAPNDKPDEKTPADTLMDAILLEKLRELSEVPPEERQAAIQVIDLVVLKYRMRRLLGL
ncbi:MAG: helix-turn-helix transcriptional regulator [Acidobacteriota bacterium]|nr:helix-turn-helix transcriptional regulator [Blastocatellia bacterium]MDW8411935.1 helix-turn-helix transcriptional regulator [Acidobacteriota bacterium]